MAFRIFTMMIAMTFIVLSGCRTRSNYQPAPCPPAVVAATPVAVAAPCPPAPVPPPPVMVRP